MAERHNGAGSVQPIGSSNRPKKTTLLGPSFDPFQHIGSLDRNRSNMWIVWFDPLLMAAAHGAGGSGGGDPAGGTGGGGDRAGGGTGGGRDRAGGAGGYGDRAGGVGEDCAVGDCGAGYGQEEVEPPLDARSVATLDVLPLTDSHASSDGLLDPPLLLCGRRSGRRGHRTLAGDAAGHEPRGTRSPAPSCSRPPPPKVRTRHPRLLHQFSVFFVMFASDF